jgi:hypothetical protein
MSMTTAMTTHLPLAGAGVRTKRSRRAAPRRLPRWLWLLGVGVAPLGPPDADGTRTWLVSAGGGVAGMAALIFETSEHNTDDRRED